MDIDFTALAARIASDAGDLRGCIIVSRDGLVLGAYPADGEAQLRPAWLKFAGLGDVEKGFLEFASELWVYVHRGPYAAFAVSGPNARPGLILEEMEQILLSAEEARSRGATAVRAEAVPESPRSKPRAPLHPEARPAGAGKPAPAGPARPQPVPRPAPGARPEPAAGPAPAARPEPAREAPAEGVAGPGPQGGAAAGPAQASPPPVEGEVDRVLLAQEFAQLLEESGYDEEEEE